MTAAAEEAPRTPFGLRFTAPLLLGSTLNPINSALIATALVGIGTDFHLGAGATTTLISVLYLCSAVAQPTMGKLSTVFGPRRVFLAGVGILFLAGLIGVLAPSFGVLLLSRALIGIGTSAAYPTAMALVRRRADSLGTGVPSRVLGNFSIAAQVTAVIGLPLGGVLVAAFGWRSLFFINMPLALISILLTFFGVAKDVPQSREERGSILTALDLPGIVLFAGTVTSLLLFLSDLAAPVWWLAALFLVLGAGLFFWERRTARPLIDFRMLGRNGPLQRTYLRQVLFALGNYSALYGVSQWMEQGKGLDAGTVGVILIPLTLTSIIVARVVSGRGWVRYPLILASVFVIAAGAVSLVITKDSSILALVGLTVLFGFANGFSGFGNQATLYIQAPAADIAVAAGLLRTALYIGAIFSSSLIGITFGAKATDVGLHELAWVLLGIGVVATALAVFDRTIPVVTSRTDG